jgi:hypothetical protein
MYFPSHAGMGPFAVNHFYESFVVSLKKGVCTPFSTAKKFSRCFNRHLSRGNVFKKKVLAYFASFAGKSLKKQRSL